MSSSNEQQELKLAHKLSTMIVDEDENDDGEDMFHDMDFNSKGKGDTSPSMNRNIFDDFKDVFVPDDIVNHNSDEITEEDQSPDKNQKEQ